MQLLQAGEADKALALLTPLPQSGQGADEAQNLLCRVQITLAAVGSGGQIVRAGDVASPRTIRITTCGSAAPLAKRPDHASFLTAFSLGKQRSTANLKKPSSSVRRNAAALSDLGDFYRQAPWNRWWRN